MIRTLTVLARNVVEHGIGHVVYAGLPEFTVGDRVCVIDTVAHDLLGDATGTVEAVSCEFCRWEYRVVADDPEGWIPTLSPEVGEYLTGDQIELVLEEVDS